MIASRGWEEGPEPGGGASCSLCWEEKWPQATGRSQDSLALGGIWSGAFNGWQGPVVLAAPLLPGDCLHQAQPWGQLAPGGHSKGLVVCLWV